MKLLTLVKLSPKSQVRSFVSDDLDLHADDVVLVDTGQGPACGTVVGVKVCEDADVPEKTPAVSHRATTEELMRDAENRLLTERAFRFCAGRIRALSLDMKLVNVEAMFDMSKLLFVFTAPTRVDFRELVKDLVKEFHTRIELRQIGVRHEAQMIGALGCCGMVCCCRGYMHEFAQVTIKMAKEQNLFLNPTKISGICGRLLCCLSFEQCNYESFNGRCPKLGKRYDTKAGSVRVLRGSMFRNSVSVLDETNEEREYTLDEWEALSPTRPVSAGSRQGARASVRSAPAGSDMVVVEADPDMDDETLERTLRSAFDPVDEAAETDSNHQPKSSR